MEGSVFLLRSLFVATVNASNPYEGCQRQVLKWWLHRLVRFEVGGDFGTLPLPLLALGFFSG